MNLPRILHGFSAALIFVAILARAQNAPSTEKPESSAPVVRKYLPDKYIPQPGDFGIAEMTCKGLPKRKGEANDLRLGLDASFEDCIVGQAVFGDSPWPVNSPVRFIVHDGIEMFGGYSYSEIQYAMMFHPVSTEKGRVIYDMQFFPLRHASDGEEKPVSDPETKTEAAVAFVIINSTPDYTNARRAAVRAAHRLRIRLDLRELTPDGEGGLTFSKKACGENGWDYPCFVWRGRFDDGAYVSVEPSSAYQGFTPGLFLVIIASGPKEDPIVIAAEKKAKSVFPTAYTKVAPIYIASMH